MPGGEPPDMEDKHQNTEGEVESKYNILGKQPNQVYAEHTKVNCCERTETRIYFRDEA